MALSLAVGLSGFLASIAAGVRRSGAWAVVVRGLVVAVGLSVVVARPAVAAEVSDSAKAEDLIRQANELRRNHMDAKALPLFQEAHEISRTPRSAAQLGLAELALGYWDAAYAHLNEALTSGRNPWVEQNRKVLESSRKEAKSHLSALTVQGTPAGAEVLLNRKVVGTLPLPAPVLVNEGQIEIEVRASAHRSERRVVTVVGDVPTRVAFTLESEAQVAKSPPPPPRTQPVEKAEELPPPPPEDKLKVRETPPVAGELPTWRKVLPWSFLGAAVVVGGLALWQQKVSSNALDDFESFGSPGPKVCGAKLPDRGPDPQCAPLYNDFSSAQTRARVGYVVAGLLGASAIGVFIWNAGTPSATVALAPGEFQLSFRSSF